MASKPRRVAIEKIENPAARNVCFSKRRMGLFRKASELCGLHPSVSVHSIVFSPAGKPFVFGNPELLSDPDLPHHLPDAIRSLLDVDISTLTRDELERYADHLRQCKSNLVSKNGNDHNGEGYACLSDGEISFSDDFGVESEFEKLRYGYEYIGEDTSFTNLIM